MSVHIHDRPSVCQSSYPYVCPSIHYHPCKTAKRSQKEGHHRMYADGVYWSIMDVTNCLPTLLLKRIVASHFVKLKMLSLAIWSWRRKFTNYFVMDNQVSNCLSSLLIYLFDLACHYLTFALYNYHASFAVHSTATADVKKHLLWFFHYHAKYTIIPAH